MSTRDPAAGSTQLKAFRLQPVYWDALERKRQELQEATPHQRVSIADALRVVINVGSGSVIGGAHGQEPGRPPDKP